MAAMAPTAMIAAGMALTMVMVMLSMMIALDIGIEFQLAFCQCLGSCISTAGNAAVKPDPSCCQSRLCTAANAAADQSIRIQGSQNTRQRAMTTAVGIHHLRRKDLSILNIIDLKLLGMAKVLEDHTIFISDCNSHNIVSFRLLILFAESVFETGFLTAVRRISVAQTEISAFDLQRTSLNKGIRHFSACTGIDQLNRGSGYAHPFAAKFLRKSLPVNETKGLIFVHRQNYRFLPVRTAFR